MGFWNILGDVAEEIGTGAQKIGVGVQEFGAGVQKFAIDPQNTISGAVASSVGKVKQMGEIVAGGTVSARNTSEKVYKERSEALTAKLQIKTEKFIASLKDAKEKLKGTSSYFQLLIALFAVGIATANADGEISKEELTDLEEFTAGIAFSHLPANVKESILYLKKNPPSFNTAMIHVKKLENIDLSLFESVIEVVSASDGRVTEEERAFLAAFREAVA